MVIAIVWWRELLWHVFAVSFACGMMFAVAFLVGFLARPVALTVSAGWRAMLLLEPSEDHTVDLRMTVDETFVRQLHAEACRDDAETPGLDEFRRLLVAGWLASELGFLEGARRRHLGGAVLEVRRGG